MVARAERFFVLSILILLFVTACRPDPPKKIIISNAPPFRPSSPKDIRSVQDELAAVLTVCRDDLGLPVIDPLHAYVYSNTASLAFYAHPGRHPAEITHQAFAWRDEIHFNLEGLGDGSRMRLWAHEYGHNVQDRLGRAKTTPLFVNEGFADWVAARVLHFLKWQDHDITRHRITRELIRHRNALPNIASLHEDAVWIRSLKQSMGHVMAPNLAFLTMDRLIRENGLAAAIAYQRNGDFKAAFGVPLAQVAAEIRNSLVESFSKKATFNEVRPEWQPGYKWTYVRNDSGSVTTTVKEVVGAEVFRGRPVFVVRSMDEETLHDKEDFTILGVRKNGKLAMEVVSKTTGLLSWPLQPQKEWRITFMEKDLTKNSSHQYDQFLVVTGVENARVSAGDFEAIKIEAYGAVTGRLLAEYWYSPKVKRFVKTRIYNGFVGATEDELSWFELKERQLPIS